MVDSDSETQSDTEMQSKQTYVEAPTQSEDSYGLKGIKKGFVQIYVLFCVINFTKGNHNSRL